MTGFVSLQVSVLREKAVSVRHGIVSANNNWKALPMKTTPAAVLLATTLGLVSGCDEINSIPAGLGYAAQDLCARVFVGKDDPTRVKWFYVAPVVSPLDLIWTTDVDFWQQKATVSEIATFQSATAVYRPGLGCTKLVNTSRAELLAQPFTPYVSPPLGAGYWPQGSSGVSPTAAASFDSAKLDVAFNDLMNAPWGYNIEAILLARDGKLARKAYQFGYSDKNRFTGWSMSKTVTALALGVAHQRQHNFSIDESAARFYPQWRGTSREAITVRNILNMESGLDWNEGYGGKSSTTEMLYNSKDMAAYVASRPLAHTPGTVFYYSTGDTLLLSGIVKQLAGGTLQSVQDFYQYNLFAPIGVTSAVVQPDISGTPVGGAHQYLSAEDWLRMGQLVLNRGRWGDKQVIDPSWIDMMATPTVASGGHYGGQVWTYDADHMARYNIPPDIILFHGFQHQLMAVIPSKNLVFLALAASTVDESDANYDNFMKPYLTALQRVINAMNP